MKDKLFEVFAKVLKIPREEADSATRNSHPHWDSLAHASLMVALEAEFNVLLETDEIIAMDSFATVEAVLRTKLHHGPAAPRAKVIVTDLDNTFWGGVAGEDGVENLQFDGAYGVYQLLLLQYKLRGVLVAAVTRNDHELAKAALARARDFTRDDFVTVLASYEAKSAQIRYLAELLNLGLDTFVFVDDNPLELAEVQAALPMVECIRFMPEQAHFALMLRQIMARCETGTPATAEDSRRTQMYKDMLARFGSMQPVASKGADLADFLRDLDQRLLIHNKDHGHRERLIQLINKTTQFNLNSQPITEEEVAQIVAEGGHAWTATLIDKNGSHGEILAWVIDKDYRMRWMAMSCRVFQRRVEFAWLRWLIGKGLPFVMAKYKPTARNAPFAQFLDVVAGSGPLPDSSMIMVLEEH